MSGSSKSEEPNLTPILDMVFQLITFFMLVINFKGATMDLSLKLPVLGSARPLDWHGAKEPMVLNIDSSGDVKYYVAKIDVKPFIEKEARLLKDELKRKGQDDKEFPVPIVIRADRTVSFHQLNSVIKTCQAAGYRKFSLNAMTKAEGK